MERRPCRAPHRRPRWLPIFHRRGPCSAVAHSVVAVAAMMWLATMTTAGRRGAVAALLHPVRSGGAGALRTPMGRGFRPAESRPGQEHRRHRATTTAMAAGRWQVGDAVRLRSNSTWTGIVDGARGGGWYTVRADPSSPTVLTVRGTQLLAYAASANVTAALATPRGSRRSSKSSSIAAASAGGDSGDLPSPPTMHDLDALLAASDPPASDTELLAQLRLFVGLDQWVVFTDLHCAPATLDTCLAVLARVHAAAEARGAGVLFLGDFWHQRGVLRVDCLNAVLAALAAWRVPMVMIPGNHDQVTLRGHDHGLTPLANAYRLPVVDAAAAAAAGGAAGAPSRTVPGVLVLSHPTTFRGALLVPHIRDAATMEAVLRSGPARAAAALFLHADVTGAYMNDLVRSEGGVPLGAFPTGGKRIYSGHFHKPHVVATAERDGVAVEYLGSPYQVSLAEAQQRKALAVVSATHGWDCVERIPIDVGCKHFRVVGREPLLRLTVKDPARTGQDPDTTVQPGDRVVCSLDETDIDRLDPKVGDRIRYLRRAGIAVEIRDLVDRAKAASEQAPNHANELDDLSPEAIWRAYMNSEAGRKAMDDVSTNSLLVAGLDLLAAVAQEDLEAHSGQWRQKSELQLNSVTLEGFGPFAKQLIYPLHGRGLVLLRGNNQDGGADSNGSGKSLLAMSTLWCLTGSLDARPVDDATVADIINDECKTARVTVRGELNGVDFSITRLKTASKSGLVFLLGGQDLSAQSAKETQALVEEKLGIDTRILCRTVFHGQHSIDSLLESTDAKFKDELALLTPLNLWQAAATKARKLGRDASKRMDELLGMLVVRTEDARRLKDRLEGMNADISHKREKHAVNEHVLLKETELVESRQLPSHVDIEKLQEDMELLAEAFRSQEARLRCARMEKESVIAPLQEELRGLDRKRVLLERELQSLYRKHDANSLRVETVKERMRLLESSWKFDFTVGLDSLTLPEECPTCGQSLSDPHTHRDLHDGVFHDASQLLVLLAEAESDLNTTCHQVETVKLSLEEVGAATSELQKTFENKTIHWNRTMQGCEKDVEDARVAYEDASKVIATAARDVQNKARLAELKSVVDQSHYTLKFAEESLASLKSEVAEYETIVENLESEKKKQLNVVSIMTGLTNAFSSRGIQTFILQNTVKSLQKAAQLYLNDLSDGSQRLELLLDAGDRIIRRAYVRDSDGDYKERALASLSGGQWRRCSIALNLGFADLLARSGRLRPSLCVLDEPLTHLDRSGRSNVGHVLRGLLRRDAFGDGSSLSVSTILLILQDLTAEELEESFDCIDEVVKQGGSSRVMIDEEC